ncbi:hypothetical protein EX30DRAFT_212099 [Ascodesmis nigricans]|uniref:Uncharacterized protein n=1 Tax=Ascodesmis nigricans TaxID=341454 RepID=A0A4S2MJL4_9PEZI|nr:hypothetical protein EX30DRAFT_212099 [Ascodesmis nigricans]
MGVVLRACSCCALNARMDTREHSLGHSHSEMFHSCGPRFRGLSGEMEVSDLKLGSSPVHTHARTHTRVSDRPTGVLRGRVDVEGQGGW